MIIACYKVFNEADYLKESVASIYDYVDKILILEGCFGAMEKVVLPSRVTSGGLSADGTTDIIKNFSDPKNKIDYQPVGFIGGDQTILYQRMVDYAQVGDYIWLVDGDEVYPSNLCEILVKWMSKGTYHAIWLPGLIFWHDFIHVRYRHGWELPHQRIYMKIDESMHYAARNLDVRWKDDAGNIYGFGLPPKGTIYKGRSYNVYVGSVDGLWYYHYAYVRSVQRILEKMLCQYLQNIEQGSAEWKHCQQFADPLEFKTQTHPWFTNHDFAEEIICTAVEHPPAMQAHGFRSIRWDEQSVELELKKARKMVREENDKYKYRKIA